MKTFVLFLLSLVLYVVGAGLTLALLLMQHYVMPEWVFVNGSMTAVVYIPLVVTISLAYVFATLVILTVISKCVQGLAE
jgi:hypothetical protein